MRKLVFERGVFIALLFSFYLGTVQGQVFNYQVKVMSWNLLNFPNSTPTDDSTLRCPAYRTVLRHAEPDILITVENTSATGASWILSNVMNTGAYHYAEGTFINGYDSDNAIYYRDSLFHFISNVPIHTALRDISHFTLKFIPTGDTLHFFAVHLKASLGYEADRSAEVGLLRQVTNALPAGSNFLVVGDFNFYGDSEPGYQSLLYDNGTNDGHFNDVANLSGTWNSPWYAQWHTQSTRLTSVGGGSTGGMDDRFDMILFSNAVEQPTGVFYLPGTFHGIGNDGHHYNQSINSGTNTSVSASVANALYNASDHLPVMLTLEIGPTSGVDELNPVISDLKVVPNPIESESHIQFNLREPSKLNFRIYDAMGRLSWESGEQSFFPGINTLVPEWSEIQGSGVFFLSVSGYKNLISSRLMIVR